MSDINEIEALIQSAQKFVELCHVKPKLLTRNKNILVNFSPRVQLAKPGQLQLDVMQIQKMYITEFEYLKAKFEEIKKVSLQMLLDPMKDQSSIYQNQLVRFLSLRQHLPSFKKINPDEVEAKIGVPIKTVQEIGAHLNDNYVGKPSQTLDILRELKQNNIQNSTYLTVLTEEPLAARIKKLLKM
ncbi:hypothetical protein RF11_11685 [Thelohanellus kitauei]|uniref:Uncharacterized protein n=1 Tax=Thelohanellus kitauei TaxID=669202 RepID=A0A0C2IZV6_THEKT|nr:hypothetical protein RF11_11685 [Thelohanellus kitauei]